MQFLIEFPFALDLHFFWSAARIALEGGNPYDAGEYYAQLHALGWSPSPNVPAFPYPPWAFWLFGPFAYLPFQEARVAWSILNTLALATCFYALYQSREQRLEKLTWKRYLFAILVFPPIALNFLMGQANWLVLTGLLGSLHFLQRDKSIRAGIMLSLTLLKPHLLLLFYLYVGLQTFVTRNFRLPVGLFVGWLVQSMLSLFFSPKLCFQFFERLPTIASRNEPGATLAQFLAYLVDSNSIRLTIVLLGLIYVVYLFLTSGFSRSSLLGTVLPLSLLCAPYSWSHSFILLSHSYLSAVEAAYVRFDERASLGLFIFASLGMITNMRTFLEPIWIPFLLFLFFRGHTIQVKTRSLPR